MSKEEYHELFLFAAKVGSLEGYLFERSKVEPLSDWLNNIDKMYHGLSSAVKAEVAQVLTPVLKRILEYGEKTLEPGLREKVDKLLREASNPG